MKPEHDPLSATIRRAEVTAPAGPSDVVDLELRPDTVLSVLEADQLVVAKEHPRFGQRQLSQGVRLLLWGLRLYVIAMMALVAIQVVNAVRGGGH
jgi:hypothetical protein